MISKGDTEEVQVTEVLDDGLKVKILDNQEECWIYKSDLTRPMIDDIHNHFTVGDKFCAMVTQTRRDGCVNLSKVKYDKHHAWEILENKQRDGESIQASVTADCGNGFRIAVLGLNGFIPRNKGGIRLFVWESVEVVPYKSSVKEHKWFFIRKTTMQFKKQKNCLI